MALSNGANISSVAVGGSGGATLPSSTAPQAATPSVGMVHSLKYTPITADGTKGIISNGTTSSSSNSSSSTRNTSGVGNRQSSGSTSSNSDRGSGSKEGGSSGSNGSGGSRSTATDRSEGSSSINNGTGTNRLGELLKDARSIVSSSIGTNPTIDSLISSYLKNHQMSTPSEIANWVINQWNTRPGNVASSSDTPKSQIVAPDNATNRLGDVKASGNYNELGQQFGGGLTKRRKKRYRNGKRK